MCTIEIDFLCGTGVGASLNYPIYICKVACFTPSCATSRWYNLSISTGSYRFRYSHGRWLRFFYRKRPFFYLFTWSIFMINIPSLLRWIYRHIILCLIWYIIVFDTFQDFLDRFHWNHHLKLFQFFSFSTSSNHKQFYYQRWPIFKRCLIWWGCIYLSTTVRGYKALRGGLLGCPNCHQV